MDTITGMLITNCRYDHERRRFLSADTTIQTGEIEPGLTARAAYRQTGMRQRTKKHLLSARKLYYYPERAAPLY